MPPMIFRGVVTRCGVLPKTASVTVRRLVINKKTGKQVEKVKRIMTHDPQEVLQLDDDVIIRNCPPVSARKRFILEDIVKSPRGEREAKHKAEQLLKEGESTKAETESAKTTKS